jgi:hypothetical protein
LAHSPNTRNAAKVRPKFKKCSSYSVSWIRWNGQKTISRYCPFKRAEQTRRSFNTTAEAAGKSLDNATAEAAGKSLSIQQQSQPGRSLINKALTLFLFRIVLLNLVPLPALSQPPKIIVLTTLSQHITLTTPYFPPRDRKSPGTVSL